MKTLRYYFSVNIYEKRFTDAKSRYLKSILDEFNRFGNKHDLEYLENLALQTHIVVKKSPANFNHGLLLFSKLAQYCVETRPSVPLTLLDVGSARGFSALVMTYVLEKFAVPGSVLSLDIVSHDTKKFWGCILDRDNGISRAEIVSNFIGFQRIIFLQGKSKEILPIIGISRVHFAFLDGDHEWRSLKHETRFLYRRQFPGDMIIFDDYTTEQYPGVIQAVKEISSNYNVRIVGDVLDRGYAVATRS